MVKRILIIVSILSFAVYGLAAADWKEDIKVLKAEVKPCAMYSLTDSKFFYSTSLQILGYKGWQLNGAYSTSENMPSLNLGYELGNLQELGVDVPLAKYVDLSIGGYIGSKEFTTDDRSSDWGLWATIIKATF